MKLKIQLPLFKKKEEEKQVSKEDTRKEDKIVFVRKVREAMTDRYKITPRTIFVASNKGGSGKSFISSSLLYILASHTEKKVFGVDLDLDNETLSRVVAPSGTIESVQMQLISMKVDYLNTADIIYEGVIGQKKHLIKYKVKIFTCGGTQITRDIRIIPAYHAIRRKRQRINLRDLDVLRIRSGLQTIYEYISSKGDIIAVFDPKQKSEMGINYDPLYRTGLEESDVVLLVTEPPLFSFSNITAQYKDYLDKMIIVVNKMTYNLYPKFKILVEDASRYNVPVFLIPLDSNAGKKYSHEEITPASNLSSKTSIYIGAIARYLNLVEDCRTKCCEKYDRIISLTSEIFNSVRPT